MQMTMFMHISREQVPVLANFGMTDFASQGRTRPFNVVDLNNCHSHQFNVHMSAQSSSLKGTILVQGFDHKNYKVGWLVTWGKSSEN